MATERGQLIGCHTDKQWEENFFQGMKSKKLVVVYFSAVGSEACRLVNPAVETYAQEFPNVIFFKVDMKELQPVANKYEVSSAPTFIFFKAGENIDRYVGDNVSVLKQLITKYAADAAAGGACVGSARVCA